MRLLMSRIESWEIIDLRPLPVLFDNEFLDHGSVTSSIFSRQLSINELDFLNRGMLVGLQAAEDLQVKMRHKHLATTLLLV
jgi:hypothetical protein